MGKRNFLKLDCYPSESLYKDLPTVVLFKQHKWYFLMQKLTVNSISKQKNSASNFYLFQGPQQSKVNNM